MSYTYILAWILLAVLAFQLFNKMNRIEELELENEALQLQNQQMEKEIASHYFIMSVDESCSTQLQQSDIIQLKVIK
jgi:hypothetical protein